MKLFFDKLLATCVCCLLFLFLCPVITQGVAAQTLHAQKAAEPLSASLLSAVNNAHFETTLDFGPFEDVCPGATFCKKPAPQIAYSPNVDIAVIQLDQNGAAEDVANVLLSRDYPGGLIVPLDKNYAATAVRWRKWDIDRWNGGTFDQTNGNQLTTKGWTDTPPLTSADDIVPGREGVPYQFMAPYPASLFKIMVAYRIMRLVDAGKLSLNDKYTYIYTAYPPDPNCPVTNCPDPDTGSIGPETRQISDWMDPMITYSDNRSTRALIKLLHKIHQIEPMNAEFRNLGLGTLQINDTYPQNGWNWSPGHIHMTAIDTARLLWLIDGTNGNRQLWKSPSGEPVKANQLTAASRSYLKGLLANQGFNEALSTVNFCGAPNTQFGIPSTIPDRWIDPADGTVTVAGIPYGRDVRPCNNIAEVVFAHKTGLTFNYGSDGGIVQSLPGKPNRHYIIAFIANLGYRYTDPVFANNDSYPCYDAVGGICYTQRIPALAKQIDDRLKQSEY